jgi:ketosteroid isomerase-like protein
MAADPVAVVKSAYAAFAAGDIPAVLALIDPDAEWIESDAESLPARGTFVGPDAVARHVFAPVPEHWDSFAIVPEEFFSDGEHVIVRGRVKATARETGTTMDAPYVHVFTVRDGRIVKLTNHHDTALWRDTLGR